MSQEESHDPSQEESQESQLEKQTSQDASQPPLQPCSCRRARAPSDPPVISDSFDERDEVLLSEGSPQPWTVESIIAR